jgi:hypothetical protein
MKILRLSALLSTICFATVLLINLLAIPTGWHILYASAKYSPKPKMNAELLMFRKLSFLIVMHASPKCRADIIDTETGNRINDEHGALVMLTYLYRKDPDVPMDRSTLEKIFLDRLKHCPADSMSSYQPLTPLQQSVLYLEATPVKLLLDAGANPDLQIDMPEKQIHGMNSLELAKLLRASKNRKSEQELDNDEIIRSLQAKMKN